MISGVPNLFQNNPCIAMLGLGDGFPTLRGLTHFRKQSTLRPPMLKNTTLCYLSWAVVHLTRMPIQTWPK